MKKIYFWLSLLFICTAFQSEKTAQIQETEYRLALVIGNGTYNDTKTYWNLDNPTKDADLMTKKLTDLGFEVITKKNLTLDGFYQAVNQFYKKAEELHNKGGKLVTVFYYAGHGEQVDNSLYLVPVNCGYISKADFNENTNYGAFSLQIITDSLENLSNELNIFMIDACRGPKFRGGNRDMFKNYAAPPSKSSEKKTSAMFYAFATLKGHLVPDGSQYNSYFVEGFVRAVDVPNRSLEEVFKETSRYVAKETNYKQTPSIEHRNFFDNFYFKKTDYFEDVYYDSDFLPNNESIEMVYIKGGTFLMGSNEYEDEQPVHSVKVSDFYIGKYEVTQKQWREVMGQDPPELSFKGCDSCPVERVSWNDIQKYLTKLNAKTGKNYRLPTEAEWEYAARGGQNYKYAGSDNINKVAWYIENSNSKTHPVGQKLPNGYGLYDMTGNVWEWCSDWYGSDYYKNSASNNPKGQVSGTLRVLRGGSWNYSAGYCRLTNRSSNAPEFRGNIRGFRLAL